jgi:hypothetical protein
MVNVSILGQPVLTAYGNDISLEKYLQKVKESVKRNSLLLENLSVNGNSKIKCSNFAIGEIRGTRL